MTHRAADEIERLEAALKTVGDDYPGSSCQRWCYQQAGLGEPERRSANDGLTCEDCPPKGYPTDLTRCAECPRRSQQSSAGGNTE